jgi:NADH-dependant formate dehydrogenase delta subunit FdsD
VDIHKLVKMANEIAKFFEAEPDRAAAVEGVASHLRKICDHSPPRRCARSAGDRRVVGSSSQRKRRQESFDYEGTATRCRSAVIAFIGEPVKRRTSSGE